MAKQHRNLITSPINSTLMKMTLPMIMAMVMVMTFGLVDTFFVSMLGTIELASISFTFPVTFTLISLNIGLGIGTSAAIATLMGQQNMAKAKTYGTGALMLSLMLVGSLALLGYMTMEATFTALGAQPEHLQHIFAYMQIWYPSGVLLSLPMVGNSILRACGDTKTPSLIMATGGLVNAILDPIFIFGFGPVPAMGIQGAAVATLIAWFSGCVIILYILAVRRRLILPRLLAFKAFKDASAAILKIGLPAAGANMLTPIAGAILTSMIAPLGSAAVATWGVGNRIESIACIVVLALSMSLPPFVSQNFGANRLERVQQAYMSCVRFVLLWQGLVAVLMWLASPLIASAFANESEVDRLIRLFLTIVPLGYGLQGIIILTNSSFNALHQPMSALALSILRLFIFFVPLSYLGLIWSGLEGVFWGGVVANLFTAMLALLWMGRTLKARVNVQQLEAESGA